MMLKATHTVDGNQKSDMLSSWVLYIQKVGFLAGFLVAINQ